MIKIGYFGPEGTFCHEAMEEYVKTKNNYTAYDYNTIQDLIFAVQNDELDEAVAPIENSLEGAVNATLDILACEVNLKIKAELVIPIKENLLVKKGTKFSDIKHIMSHPQPIGQCRKYINANFPNVRISSGYSTAGAALEVSKGNGDSAAIGSITAARVYGLDVLAQDIQDGENNFTRFIVAAKNDSERTGQDKTSIVFSTENKPGSLYRVLDIFNLWDINMTKIESRPAKNQFGKYIFFIDLTGHRDDEDIKNALIMVKRRTSFFKFLGSYPQSTTFLSGN